MKRISGKAVFEFLLNYSGYVAIALVVAVFTALSPRFLLPENLLNIVSQSSYLGIIGCGMTAILIGGGDHVIRGGIDLSLANNMAMCATLMSFLLAGGASLAAALGAGLLMSLGAGLLIALVVVKLKVAPLLATLSMMYILQGTTLLVSNNRVTSVDVPVLTALADRSLLGLPYMGWAFLLVAAALYIAFGRTAYGNRVMAVGGNQAAAETAGVGVDLHVASTYLIASATAFVSAVLALARLSGSVPGMGDTIFLDVILIGYMSAIFSRLAVANIPGAFLSALFVGMLSNGFTMINVPTYWVYAVKGLLILISVSITTMRKRRVA